MRGCCEKCGSGYNLECHHLVRRSIRAARWVLELAMCLCENCHRTGPESAHGNPDAFNEWLEREMPEKAQLVAEYTYRRSFEKADPAAAARLLKSKLFAA